MPKRIAETERKDALLQENSYTVLRFLAEDVDKRLDDVLDSILHQHASICDRLKLIFSLKCLLCKRAVMTQFKNFCPDAIE